MKMNPDKNFHPWLVKLGLMLITSILLTTCYTQPENQSNQQQSKNLHGKIILWAEIPPGLTTTHSIKNQTAIKFAVEDFSKLYPETEVLMKFFPQGEIFEPFEQEVARGAGPDLLIVYATTQMLKLIQSGILTSIDADQVDQSRFRPDALKAVRYQGQLYGFPLYLSTQVLCYNRDQVKQPPQILPELTEQARQGYSVGLVSGFTETFWGTGIFDNRQLNDPTEAIWEKGRAWSQWMEWLKEAQNEPNVILSDDVEALQQAFIEGKLAYLTCLAGWIPYLSESLGKNKLAVARLPGGVNQPATPLLRTGILLFNRASSPNQSQIALKLAQFLTNVEQQKHIEGEIPFIPSNKNITINRQLFPIRATLIDQSRSTLAISLDDAEKIQGMENDIVLLYQQVLAGEITSEQAATQFTLIFNR